MSEQNDASKSVSGKWSVACEVRRGKHGPWIMVSTFIVTHCPRERDAWLKADRICNPLADPKVSVRCVNWEPLN